MESLSVTSSNESPMLSTALEWASRGFDVLPLHSVNAAGGCTCGSSPCPSAGKHPRTRRGSKDASRDERTISRWFQLWPDSNLGVIPGSGNCVVVDIDPRNAPTADLDAWMNAASAVLEDATMVKTGEYGSVRGTHFWFRSENARRAGAGQLQAGVEWKSSSGYVVIPPSRHPSGATYELARGNFESLTEAPDWLEIAMESKPVRRDSSRRVRGSLTGVPIGKFALDAIEFGLISPKDGQTQRESAVGIARNLREAGIPKELALVSLRQALLHPDATHDHSRPWSEADVESIVDSVFAEAAPDQREFLEPRNGQLVLRDLNDAFNAEHEEIRWLVRGLLTRGDKMVIAAPAKGKKTFLALHLARCIATGEPFLGREEWAVEDHGPVIFVEEEHGLGRWDIRLRSVFEEQREAPFFYIHKPHFSFTNPSQVEQLIDHAISMDARLIVVDPWQLAIPGVNENDAGETGPAFAAVHRIADESGAAVLVLHHTNKAGSELSFESIRGTSRMMGEVDVIMLSAKRGNNRIEIRIEGRDIEIDSDSTVMAEHEPDKPYALTFVTEKEVKGKQRNRTAEAAERVLRDAGGWLTTREVRQQVAALGVDRSQERVRKVLAELLDGGKLEHRGGQRGKAAEWKWAAQ